MEEWAKMLDRKSNIPMPLDGYIVDKQKLEELGDLAKPLTPAEVSDYLTVVGSLIWIVGVRFDVSFALMYLTWYSKAPSYHHLKMAFRIVGYLNNTKALPAPQTKVGHFTVPNIRGNTKYTGSKVERYLFICTRHRVRFH